MSGGRASRGLTWLRRPELGVGAGLLLVFGFFALAAPDSGMFSALGLVGVLEVSAELALLAAPVALLMIAGEFDLSVGSMVAFAGMVCALAIRDLGWTASSALLFTLGLAAALGALNGLLVVRTRLPSFIVTLAALFILRGLTLGGTRALTGRTVVGGLAPLVESDPVAGLFSGQVLTDAAGVGLPVSALWALGVTGALAFVLRKTPFGNWALAVGGDADAARSAGVPVDRVKITLFTLTALGAALLACLQVMDAGSADTNRGLRDEFEAIIAAVIGGTLLSGGYGSVLGASLGALLFGAVQMGIFYTGADTDWFQLFLGVMLLAAVSFNDALRRRLAERAGPAELAEPPPEHAPDVDADPAADPARPERPLLEARRLSRRFGPVSALEEVDLELFAGEVHAVLGDNGAGKSTLIRLLSGVHAPSAGELRLDDAPVRFDSPRDALQRGIATVHQHLALAPLMSVARNFFLGREPTRGRGALLDLERARHETIRAVATLGIALDDADRPVGTLSGGQRQCVAIARALRFGARVLILDEPTSALGVRQAALVLTAARAAADRGLAVVLITHDVEHAWSVADRFTLLGRGRVLTSAPRAGTTRDEVLAAMAGGREVDLRRPA